MKIIKTFFDEAVKLIEYDKFNDDRGYFSVTYNKSNFKQININQNFLQDNFSYSKTVNTFRGIHYQKKPYEQAKLINIIKGSIFDVFVDLRLNSKTFGQFESVKLDSAKNLLFIPEGFGHAFLTLENDTLIHYKISNKYNLESEQTIIWNDKELKIDWPKFDSKMILSEKDKNGISLQNFKLKNLDNK